MGCTATATPEGRARRRDGRRPLRVTLHRIPPGPAGTARTVAHMRWFILRGAKDFAVRRRAVRILTSRGVRPKDYLGEIKALFEWVRGTVRYTRDPHRVELLHSARRMIQLRAGDCDDMTILLGALLQSVGHPVRVVLCGPDATRPGLFTHVYLEVRHRGRWIALDATMPHPMGWAPNAPVKKVIPLRRGLAMEFAAVDGTLGQLPMDAGTTLVAAVRGTGLPARDQRVREIWYQLRSRGLLDQDPWVRWALRRIWDAGLGPGYRPRTADRLETAFRGWGLLTTALPAYGYPAVSPYAPYRSPWYPRPGYPVPAVTLDAEGIRALLDAVRQGTLGARDPRVAALWRLLRERAGTGTPLDPAVRQLLLGLWRSGSSGGAPDALRQLVAVLRGTGLLSRTGRRGRTTPWRGSGYGYGTRYRPYTYGTYGRRVSRAR
ncbi:transglutaminase-like domain-containing protein [Streptomyces sp. NBC_01236]|uniref:transglutaminase-like domain-containing protein n=1 Tax=Streptomyces sp. NBC_01236 TaxID=2903789 RepID=UPI002E12D46B|nr:transglutaminase-like domain-containing protein [Streptomyces sp. NBC_01236]